MKHLILILVITPALLFSQGWEKTYDFDEDDSGNSVQQTADGGYIITGYAGHSDGPFFPSQTVLLIKTDSDGDTLWTRTFGSGAGSSVQQCTDGGYIVAGRAGWGDPLNGNGDVYLVKTDENGDTLWTRTFGGGFNDEAYSVQQCNDGGYIIAGYLRSGSGASGYNTTGSLDGPPPVYPYVYLIKTDSSGDTLWTRIYGGEEDYDYGYSVKQCDDGGYIIAGEKLSEPGGVYLIKADSNGDTLWTKTFGSGVGRSVQQCTDGGYIVAGTKGSPGDVYLIKTDSDGDSLWTKTYGGADHDFGHSLQQCTDGGYIIAGSTYSFGNGESDVYLIKTDSNGDTLWTRTFGGGYGDGGHSVQQCADGGYIISGSLALPSQYNGDVYLIKTNENGMVTFTTEIPLPEPNRKLIKMVDLSGREMLRPKKNQPYIEIYEDGSTQKKMKIK